MRRSPAPPLKGQDRPTPGAAAPWFTQALVRMRRHFWLKTFGFTAFMSLFFIAYFHILRQPAYAVTLMPLTTVDRLIGFQPLALPVYLSLWFYVGIAPMLLRQVRELIVYSMWMTALCVAGLAVFYFWPTAAPPHSVDLAKYPAFAVLQGVDAAGNAFPSLHVATAVFTAGWVDHLLRELRAGRAMRILNWSWLLLISYSTLAIKQHVLLDLIAGWAFGLAFVLPSLAWRSRNEHA